MKIKFWWKLNAVLGISLVLLLWAAVPAGADETRYFYDDAGRLYGVFQQEGDVAVYRYDSVGNILAIDRSTGTDFAPRISSISPDSAGAQTVASVVISGTNLTGSTVTTDNPGIAVSGIRNSGTAMAVTLNLSYFARWGTTLITVSNPFGSSGIDFTVIPGAPAVTKLDPDQGPVSRLVEITGSGFSSEPSENAVFFSGVPARTFSASPTRILTSVPEGATSGPVTVRVRGGAPSEGKSFQVTGREAGPPTVTRISPNVGSVEGGCSVTISGSGFAPNTVIYFGKEKVTDNAFIDSSTLRFTTPPSSAGTYDVLVSNWYGDALVQGGYTYLDATRLQVVSVSPELSSSGLPLNGLVSVWFSRAIDLATFGASGFSLTEKKSGAPVTGVFSSDFGDAEAIFKPTAFLKEGTEYVVDISTGVRSTDGMPLAQPVHGSFHTGNATDTSLPQFTILPQDGASGVPVNELITFVFSEPMCTPTINAASVTVTNNGTAVNGTIRFGPGNTVATFIPYSNFLPSSTVTVSLSGKVTDPAGNPAAASGVVSTFTTATTSSMEPPYVLSVDPPDGSEEASAYTSVTATFNKSMDPTTVSGRAFVLRDQEDGSKIPGNLSFSDDCRVVTFTPEYRLNTGHEILVWIWGADLAGNGMPAGFESSFTTSNEINPRVTKTNPADGAAGLPLNTRMVISFSKRMDPATVDGSTLYLTKGGEERVSATVSLTADGLLGSIQPTAAMAPTAGYTIHFTGGMKDMVEYPVENPGTVHFATGEALDETPPTVTMVTPANGARGVPLNASVAVRFSEPVNETTVNGNSVIVSHDGTALPGDLSFEESGSVVRYRPKDSGAFEPNAFYLLTLTTSITDGAGNPLSREYVAGFTTGDSADTTPPEVVSFFPADGTADVPTDVAIEVTFSEPIDPSSVNGQNIRLLRFASTLLAFNEHSQITEIADCCAGTLYAFGIPSYPVSGTITTSTDRRKVIFTPDYPILAGAWEYRIDVFGVADLAANVLEGFSSSGFYSFASPGTDRHGLPFLATISIDSSTLVPDGVSRAAIQITDIMDNWGNTVADGTIIGVTADAVYGVASAGGTILEGTESASYPGFKFFTVSGGAVTLTYRAPNLPDLAAGQSATARVQVYSVDTGGLLVGPVGDPLLVTLTR